MIVTPVKKYVKPQYPDKQMALENPQILRNMPERWKGNACITAAMSSLLVITLAGCAQDKGGVNVSANGKAAVAPVFDHGNGRGSFGCESIAPPSYLSEEEAFQVVQQEAKRYGITFEKESLELKEVGLPETRFFALEEEKKSEPFSLQKGNLTLDGYDGKKKVGFEFISEKDYSGWSKDGRGGIIESYDYLSAAKGLQEGLIDKNGEASIAVFYNPMIQLTPQILEDFTKLQDFEARKEKLAKLAEEELRKQVKDFLKWLKAQGII